MQFMYDIAIIGSGFGGSIMAMVARRLGRSVILLERGQHPRFAIGESSTPLANLLLEEISDCYSLPKLKPLSKWGTWQQTYPHVGCGLKRGFTFYFHQRGETWRPRTDRSNELLVAASPHDQIADTHWYRPDFDHLLVQQAQAEGVNYMENVQIDGVALSEDAVTLSDSGRNLRISARFVIDATGPRGAFLRHRKSGTEPMAHMPSVAGLYTHFAAVKKLETITARDEIPPYPIDDAAVHHVFPGGWIWVLRFNNGITSAGVAATPALADELQLNEGEAGWKRLLKLLPTVAEQFAGARAVVPWVYAPQMPFRVTSISGPRWALLPSAAGFVDPLLSTGFPLTLLGIMRLARILEREWESPRLKESLCDYQEQTREDLHVAEHLVAALYRNFSRPECFIPIAFLYFAAASFTETARRLGKPELAGSRFLMADHAHFGKAVHALCDRTTASACDNAPALRNEVAGIIERFDVAGFTDFSRRNWFPVLAKDLLNAATKLEATPEDMLRLLKRCGI